MATPRKTNPTPPSGRSTLLRRLLAVEGLSVTAAASRARVSVRWVYDYAAKHHLPTNARVTPNGNVEAQIIRALVVSNMNRTVVARLFNQAPINITTIIKRVRLEARVADPR